MTVTTQPVVGTMPAAVGALAPERKKVSWGGIFAGTVIGLAIMVMLGLLGAGIGLWATEPGGETDSIATMSVVSAIYFVICQLIALAVGGYAASRMSATWDKQNAMLHGASVWGLTTLAAVYLATSGATLLYNNTVSAISSAASTAQNAAAAVIPNDLPNFNLPEMQMSDLPSSVQQALRDQGVTASSMQAEAREAFNNVISEEERNRAASIATNTATDIIRSPGDAMSDIDAAIDNLVGRGGVISQEDRAELVTVMERRFGVTPQEAEQLVARWETRAKTTFDNATKALEDARAEALDVAQQATDALGTASFWAFIASLLGLGAAVAGAGAGRRERPLER